MAKRQYFVLGIGGTGMRCIESLIHLCAMGMFDETDIHLLALDTDSNNGNFARLKSLKEAYIGSKGGNSTLKDTFFSANLNYYEFSPNYDRNSSFKAVYNYAQTQNTNKGEADLADLVFSKDVEGFNLRHGYRAQTHLGSMMMYHSIIDAAKSPRQNDLKRFLSQLTTVSTTGNPRVFILGSVFGGTGASSIPVIPHALSKAAEIVNGGTVNVFQSAYFGSTLLTAYFNFKSPSETELQSQKIVAASERFALNSQVAMMFYDDDPSVRSTYQKFYMLGTEGLDWKPMKDEAQIHTITGGETQINDSHFIELLAACAALDFLNDSDSNLNENKLNNATDYVYRAIDESGRLDFKDFVGTHREEEFAKKFGTLIAFGLFNNGTDNLVERLRNKSLGIEGFDNMSISQIDSLREYFRLFFAAKKDNGDLDDGWLKQLHRSAGKEDNMLFNAALFAPNTYKALMAFDWNKKLYQKEGIGKDHVYAKSWGSKFNDFKKEFIKINTSKADEITNPSERAYKLIFDTLAKVYKF